MLSALIVLAGCSRQQQPAPSAADREVTSLQPLKAKYSSLIQGMDVKGSTLDLYVNEDQLNSIDEPVEDEMKAVSLAQWKSVWKRDHPVSHSVVRVRLRNYFGEVLFTESAKT